MRFFKIFFILIFISLSSCNGQNKFDQEIWLKNNDISIRENPRFKMVNDILENHLRKGMSKSSIIELLGKPNTDALDYYLPNNKKLPDSLEIDYDYDKDVDKKIELISEWYKKNQKSAPMLKYHLGWTLIDTVSLEIILNEGIVIDYWVKQN